MTCQTAAQRLEYAFDSCCGDAFLVDSCAEDALYFAECERDGVALCSARFDCCDPHVYQFTLNRAAIGKQDATHECRGNGCSIEIRSAFEAMAGVGVQAVAARRTANRHGVEPGSLNEYVGGGGSDHRVPAAHDASKCEGLRVIGYDQVFRIECAIQAVECFEALALAGAAHHDAAFDLVQVEGVRGLAHGYPCKVGGVYGVGDLLLLKQAEVGCYFRAWKPVARTSDGDAAQYARGKAAAGVLGLDLHGKGLGGGLRCGQWEIERRQCESADGRRLACNAVVVHCVDAVGGDVHLVERAVACAEIVHAFNGYAAQGQVFGEFRIVDRQSGNEGFEPFG